MGHTYQFAKSTMDHEHFHNIEMKRRKRNHGTRLNAEALIVDDDHSAAQLLQLVLMNFGIRTTLVFDGKEALKQIARKTFDIIFLDICMPELSGADVLAKIEDLQNHHSIYYGKSLKLPVITYSSFDQDKLNLPEERGFHIVGHWQKPISLPELAVLTGKTITQLHLPIITDLNESA